MAPRAQCCSSLPLIAAVLATISLYCCAKPEFYVTHDNALNSFEQPTPLPGCTDQPLKAYGLHAGLAEDTSGTTFSLTPAPQAGGTLCKGVLYTLKVDFPDARYALLTSVGGVLGNSNAYTNHWGNKPDTCAGKRLLVQPKEMVATFSTTLQVPCTSAATSVALEITSAATDKAGFQQITSTHNVVACPTVLNCATAPAPTPVETTPSTTTGGNSTSGEDDGDDEGGSDAQEGDDSKGGLGDDSKGGSTGPVTTTTTQSGSTTTGTTASGGSMSLSGSSVSGSTVGGSGVKCAAADATTCTPSTFGYSCVNTDKVSVHYAYSTCVPDNECTRGAKWTTNGPPATPLLHMAAEAKTNGYVSVGFAKKPGDMPGTDAVLGYIGSDNQAFLQVFPLSKTAIGDPYPNSASMLSYSSVLKTADGRTIVCFARPLNSSNYKYSPTLDPNNLQLNQAYSNSPALVFHAAASGLTINAVSGAVSGDGGGGDTLIYVHGALMTLAWIAFAPLGATLARHRWALGDTKLAGIHVWFQMHRLIQVAAVMTSAVAFIIALTSLDAGDTKIGESHKLLGILVMALAVLQVIIAVPRPKPDSPHRHKWNLAHWWLGRTTVVAGITACYLGIVLFHKNDAEPLARWLAPTIAWLGALLIVEVILSVMRTRHTEPKPSVTATAAPMMPGTPEGGIKGAPARSPSYGHV